MATAMFIDSRSRELKVSFVSVTESRPGELVLRFGGEAPPLWELVERGNGPYEYGPFWADCPIIIAERGYEAQSSAGFVRVLVGGRKVSDYTPRTFVVGMQGFGEKPALRRIGPMPVRILPAGTEIRPVATHSDGHGRGNSNTATADAAYSVVVLRSKVWSNSLFLVEGQSDYTRAWACVPPAEGGEMPAWPEEHRGDIFRTPRVTLSLRTWWGERAAVTLDEGRKYATFVRGEIASTQPLTPAEALRQLVGVYADWAETTLRQITLTWDDAPAGTCLTFHDCSGSRAPVFSSESITTEELAKLVEGATEVGIELAVEVEEEVLES